jgi:ATP-dependent RNA helicase DeaD
LSARLRLPKENTLHKLLFSASDLPEDIKKALAEMGFEEATPIQSLAIPAARQGRDIIGQAQTGTGKTAAFSIPLLEKIDVQQRCIQALVLCPTRELAIQIAEEMKRLGAYKRKLGIVPVYGGQPIERQLQALRKGAQVVVGTPGRVMDHLQRGTIALDHLRVLVLDEADEMLNMGFIEDIETILKTIPAGRQTLLFAATMPAPILAITQRYQNDPQLLSVVHAQLTVPNIEQSYVEVREQQKLEALSRLLDTLNTERSLVFCNTKKRVDEVVAALNTRGYQAEGLHGDLNQVQRDRVMNHFRKGDVAILVATDVAARGIDVSGIDVVFNFDLPWDEEDYVHRIGRTARAGKSGRAYTFASSRDLRKLRDIQRYTGTHIRRQQIPSLRDVEASRQEAFIEKVNGILEAGLADRHLRLAERLLSGDTPSLDVTAALVGLLVGPEPATAAEEANDLRESEDDGSRVTVIAAVGREHRVSPGDIVGAITGETGLTGKSIGAIRIFDHVSFIDIPAKTAQRVIEIMNRSSIRNVAPEMRLAEANEMPGSAKKRPGKSGLGPRHGYPGPNKKTFKKGGKKSFFKDRKRK